MAIKITCRCGKTFVTYPSRMAEGRGKVCSLKCRDAAKREAALTAGSDTYFFYHAKHILQPAGGTVPEHRIILYAKIGPGPHPCHWCNVPVDWKPGERTSAGALVVDHLDENKKNNAPGNLVPSCHRCNCGRGIANPIQDDELYVLMKGRNGAYQRHRAVLRACGTCGKQFKWLAADKRPGRGKYCSRDCLYKKQAGEK